jgi:hypothetical protein
MVFNLVFVYLRTYQEQNDTKPATIYDLRTCFELPLPTTTPLVLKLVTMIMFCMCYAL